MRYAVRAMMEILNLTSQGISLNQIADKEGLSILQKLYEPSLLAEILNFQATSGAAVYFPDLTGITQHNFPLFSKVKSA